IDFEFTGSFFELADFFHPQAEQHGVRLRLDLAPGPLTADLDAPHVKQALLNLMLNAVQAMSDPGRSALRADTSANAPRELILRTARETGQDRRPCAAVHVIDTGPGIPHDTLLKVFDPYFTTRSGGTGLGLPTARRIIEAHGGRLDARTEVGRGTDFVASFPTVGPTPRGQGRPTAMP
ncbi:MAG: ATP-binding protein, partial [Phycisphaerales bacterium]